MFYFTIIKYINDNSKRPRLAELNLKIQLTFFTKFLLEISTSKLPNKAFEDKTPKLDGKKNKKSKNYPIQ